jgi:hypothetical protein
MRDNPGVRATIAIAIQNRGVSAHASKEHEHW